MVLRAATLTDDKGLGVGVLLDVKAAIPFCLLTLLSAEKERKGSKQR